MRQMRRLHRVWLTLRRRGLGYPGYLIPNMLFRLFYQLSRRRLRQIVLLSGAGTALLALAALTLFLRLSTALLVMLGLGCIMLLTYVAIQKLKLSRMQKQARAFMEINQPTYTLKTFTSWTCWPVDAPSREAIETFRKVNPNQEIVIGRIDADGRVLGLFGELPNLKSIDQTGFVEQRRYQLDIVLIGDNVLVRKDFCGNKAGFLREWYNLALLYGKANVPAVYRVDEDRCRLYKNLIAGQTIRDILVNVGARILNVQTKDDPELAELDQASRIKAVWTRGRALMPACLSEEFLDELEQQLNKIHTCGVAGLSFTFGNIIVDSENNIPWLIDFEGAHTYRSTANLMFAFRREQDRVKFNQIYGRDLMTEQSARTALTKQTVKVQRVKTLQG